MKKKLLIITNPLSFFISHRLEIADAAMKNGYDVKVGYGELGNSNTETLEFLSKKGINCFLSTNYLNIFKSTAAFFLARFSPLQ